MLLKDFYIDKFCKKIKEAEPLPDTEYKQGLVGDRNSNRPNGKAWKKNPRQPKTNSDTVNGRSPANHAKREAWKAWKATQPEDKDVPHWKEWKVNAA